MTAVTNTVVEPETFVKRSFVFLNSLGVREFTSRCRRFKLNLTHLNTSLGYFISHLFTPFVLPCLQPHPHKISISPDAERNKTINQKPEPKIYLQSNLFINNLIHRARTTCTDIITWTSPWCNPHSFSCVVVNEQLVQRRRAVAAAGREGSETPRLHWGFIPSQERHCWIGY